MPEWKFVLQWSLIAASLVLQVLLLATLVRGAYRRYPFVFLYSLVLFFTTVTDAAMVSVHGSITGDFAQYYYRVESLRQLLLFAVVVSLVDRAASGSFSYRHARLLVAVLAVTAVVLSFSIHSGSDEYYSLLRTKVGRDLSFVAVLINLALWTLLISRKSKDRELLMVTGALGIQFTGEAIGQSLRQVAAGMNRNNWILLAGNLMLVLPHILRLYIWWETFRKSPLEAVRTKSGRQPESQLESESTRQARLLSEAS